MTEKLDRIQSVQIVLDAIIEISKQYATVSDALQLGEILIFAEERDLFRANVHHRVKAVGFLIESHEIPNEPGVTIGDIAKKLSISALPGEPATPDPA
jgi:hypothetical protein